MNFKKYLRTLEYKENINYYGTYFSFLNQSNTLIDSILGNIKITYNYRYYNSFNNAINKARKSVTTDNDICYCHILAIENKIKKGLFVYTITKSEVKYKAFYDLEKIRVFQ